MYGVHPALLTHLYKYIPFVLLFQTILGVLLNIVPGMLL